jgi:trimeric autotransporter adhesin
MSTKTTFKRIALVAVAALGLGVLSVAPSSAAVANLTVTVANGTSAAGQSDSRTAATVTVGGFIAATGDSISVQVAQKSIPAGATTQYNYALVDTTTSATFVGLGTPVATGSIADAVNGTSASTKALKLGNQAGVQVESSTASSNGFAVIGAANTTVGATFAIQLDSTTAKTSGTYTYTVVVKTWNNLAPATGPTTTQTYDVNIVVAATAAESKTPSAVTSFARLNLTSDVDAAGTDAVIQAVSTASATPVGYLEVGVRNASNQKVAQDSVTATITGAGILKSGSVTGSSFKLATTGDTEFEILADGRAGVATITVSTNGTTYAAKTITFYAKAAKTITAKVEHPVLKVGANADAVSADAVDANGTSWRGTAYIVASSAADALVAGSATTPVACAFNTTDLVHYCPVTAISAGTAKLKIIDASTVAAATATSNEITVTVSAATVASVKLAFDKATYAPFEKATITVTPLDATGKAISAQTDVALLATGGITSTYAFTAGSDTLTATTFSTSALTGAKTYTVYMPAASGDVVITATGGTALPGAGQVKVTATAAVVNPSVDAATDAANEATDAANAATDAALAAADAADAATAAAQDASDAVAALSASVSKLISSLRAQITSLTNLVIKIQKKVRA